MIRIIFIALLASSVSGAATAPDSIAGTVYRSNEVWKGTSPRFRDEHTIIFEDTSRFVYLKFAQGVDFLDWNRSKVEVKAPLPDGTYVYRRTTDASAEVDLRFDDGSEKTLSLTFTSARGGGGTSQGLTGAITSSFFLSDYKPANATAPSNVSMRGVVAPGRPLIVGFIVPGSPIEPRGPTEYVPHFGERAQEVLIRAIGPSLQVFGVENVWSDPDFELHKGGALAEVDEKPSPDWDSSSETGRGLRKIFSHVSAFPLLGQSNDAVGVMRLSPGAYTIVCNALPGDLGGEALIEVYFLP